MSPPTLRGRLMAAVGLGTVVAMCLMIASVIVAFSALSDHQVQQALRTNANAVAATLHVAPGGNVVERAGPDATLDQTTWVYGASGHRLLGPSTGRQTARLLTGLAHTQVLDEFSRGDTAFLGVPVRVQGRPLVVIAAASLNPYEANRSLVVEAMAVLGLLVVAGAVAMTAWVTRRALRPVASMARIAEDWSEHHLDSRFGVPGHDEIAALGHTLDVLLDRVGGAIRHEQRLTAELAHELRTPLTAIRAEAELASMRAPSEALRRIITLVDSMGETIETLLSAARGHAPGDTRCRAGEVFAAVRHGLPDASIVTAQDSDLEIAAPAELVQRALAPLVSNAVRFAASSVRLGVRVEDRYVLLDVIDDGPGVSGDVDRLFEAGERSSDSPGAGLGLALTRRVARSLGGDAIVTSATGPTTFSLRLPRS